MAVKIRLKRIGAKKHPYYRIVVADARYPRDGRFIEQIGTYDPMSKPEKMAVDGVRALKWIKNGAQPTETVKSILKKTQALEKAAEQLAQQELDAKAAQAAQDAQAALGGQEAQAGQGAQAGQDAQAGQGAQVAQEATDGGAASAGAPPADAAAATAAAGAAAWDSPEGS